MRNGYFSDASIIRKIYRDKHVSFLIGMRALLMQATQLVAMSGMQNSALFANPIKRAADTQRVMETIYFGTVEEANAVTARVHNMHSHVRGTVGPGVGKIPADTEYSALNPNLQKWLIATLIDSAIYVHELYVGWLTSRELDQLVSEFAIVASLFGVPVDHRFTDYLDFREYMDAMYSTVGRTDSPPDQRLEVTPQTRHTALSMTLNPATCLLGPLQPSYALLIKGTLPPKIRALYAIEWNGSLERQFQTLVAAHRNMIGMARLGAAFLWCNPLAWAWIPFVTPGPMFYSPGRTR